MKNVLVVFGGVSVEHDISIITGLGVLNNISKEYNAVGVYIDKQNNWWTGESLKEISTFQPFSTKKLKKCMLLPSGELLINTIRKKRLFIYSVVNCMHGHNGEDGALSGLLQMYKIPHTSASALCGSVCMDKTITKQILSYNKIKVVDYISIDKADYNLNTSGYLKQVEKKIGFPCIVKPNSLGSSIGVNVANNTQDFCKCLDIAFSFDQSVLIEKYLQDVKELNIAAFKDENKIVLSNIEEVCVNKLYEFNIKYKSKSTKRIVPAKIENDLEKIINGTATKIYNILKCSGVVRFDFLYSQDVLYLNEVNTTPGSLACYLFKNPKIKYNSLITKLIENSVLNYNNQSTFKCAFESDVLLGLTKDNFKMSK